MRPLWDHQKVWSQRGHNRSQNDPQCRQLLCNHFGHKKVAPCKQHYHPEVSDHCFGRKEVTGDRGFSPKWSQTTATSNVTAAQNYKLQVPSQNYLLTFGRHVCKPATIFRNEEVLLSFQSPLILLILSKEQKPNQVKQDAIKWQRCECV